MNQDFFRIYKNALSANFCNDLITKFEASESKVEGRVGNGTPEGMVSQKIKQTTELYLSVKDKV
ncbi:hypothetical protein [Pleionea mediterranea]|uniref:Uncharacterized protein n=1 Tax=Pleionea mediterranea TaxID=523701 RepID=A0A316FWL7_9GAMM|nr:hypothetical protein [Pleionea mediterranea]PWK51990.1 hypothetical protein C8D97_105307 [Pleionea mediterranea]